MKTLRLSGAMLGLTVLLTACPGPTPLPGATHILTVKLEGVSGAPVTVTNTNTNTEVFKGTLSGSKTFGELKAGDVFRVEGGAVGGYATPAAQTVTLNGDKTVTLAYAASPQPETTHSLTVKVEGVASAPVTVTNTSTNTAVFSGTLEGSKTFGSLRAGDVFRVEGGVLSGYGAPGSQTLTLDADKTATLAYSPLGQTVGGGRVTGKIVGNTLKIAKVVLDISVDPFFGVAAVDANNSFTLDLSVLTPPAGRLFPLVEGCTPTGANTNPGVQVWANSIFDAYGPGGDRLGTVVQRITSGTGMASARTRVSHMYASADAVFQGTCTYTTATGQIKYDYDIALKAGWNALALTEDGITFTYRNVGSDTRSELQFTPAEPGVTALLNPRTLTFTSDDPVTADVVFAQVGGYSGTVTLRTDDPDLTVEPSTITLPALAAQGVATPVAGSRFRDRALDPQSVQQKLTFRYRGADFASKSFELQVLDGQGRQVGRGSGVLNVQRPGISVSTYQANTQVTPGGSVQLPVQLSSTGNFSGQVTVRLENLPAGVTADTRTVALNGYHSTFLTLTGGPALTPGEYQATLVAEGGGRVARTPVSLVIPKPSVGINIVRAYEPVYVYQGAAASIEVSVNSDAGFSGTTTLTTTGLPQGVNAPPVSVSVALGTTTTVRIPITATADAPLETSTAVVSSPDQGGTGANNVRVTVRPARTAIGPVSGGVIRAGRGLWSVSSVSYTSAGYQMGLTRYGLDGQAATTTTINPGSSWHLVSLRSGDVLLVDTNGASFQVNDAGEVSQKTAPLSSSYDTTLSREEDALGRVWFVRRTYLSTGNQSTALAYWKPSSGEVTVVDSTRNYGSSGGTFVVSPDARTLAYLPSYGGQGVRIDASSGTVSDLSLTASGQSVALSNAGLLWYAENSLLKRVNADGSVTSFQNLQVSELTGFDRADEDVLWGKDYSGVVRIDTAASRASSFSVSSLRYTVTLNGGGLAAVTEEYDYSSSNAKSFLTILK